MATLTTESDSLAAWRERLQRARQDVAAGHLRDAGEFLAELEAEDRRPTESPSGQQDAKL